VGGLKTRWDDVYGQIVPVEPDGFGPDLMEIRIEVVLPVGRRAIRYGIEARRLAERHVYTRVLDQLTRDLARWESP
jgi:hypothetical protein